MNWIDVPSSWEASVELILKKRPGRVLVLGQTDRGKSTYCLFLLERLERERGTVALVDADTGQKDVGPPAAVTLGYSNGRSSRGELLPLGFYFIGATSPVRHLLPMVVGTRKLVDQAVARADLIIINTTGFLHGPGRALKEYKIETTRPDLLLALDPGRETLHIRRAVPFCPAFVVSPSPKAVPKSPELRRSLRDQAFGRYFQEAGEADFRWSDLTFQRRRPPDLDPEPERYRHLLCGVADSGNECLGLAVITRIDGRRRRLSLATPVEAAKIAVLQLGDMQVTLQGREVRAAESQP